MKSTSVVCRSVWIRLLLAALACLALTGCPRDDRRRLFFASCGVAAECESNLCISGVCSRSCITSSECGSGVCLEQACVPLEKVECEADTSCNDLLQGRACQVGVCSSGKCAANNASDGLTCATGNSCEAFACSAGACKSVSGLRDCDDAIGCTTDSCDPSTGCVHTPVDAACAAGGPCELASCVATKGCTTRESTGACSDNNPCTLGDTCQAGVCAGSLLQCNDANACTSDACDTALGTCVYTPISASCDDGNPCTSGDACTNGACVGYALSCDDKNPCTLDGCNAQSGQCTHAANPGSCSDNDACTSNDTCQAGVCVGTAVLCDDGNPCTSDSCSTETGLCGHLALTGGCDDGNPCTTGELCKDGQCEGTPTGPFRQRVGGALGRPVAVRVSNNQATVLVDSVGGPQQLQVYRLSATTASQTWVYAAGDAKSEGIALELWGTSAVIGYLDAGGPKIALATSDSPQPVGLGDMTLLRDLSVRNNTLYVLGGNAAGQPLLLRFGLPQLTQQPAVVLPVNALATDLRRVIAVADDAVLVAGRTASGPIQPLVARVELGAASATAAWQVTWGGAGASASAVDVAVQGESWLAALAVDDGVTAGVLLRGTLAGATRNALPAAAGARAVAATPEGWAAVGAAAGGGWQETFGALAARRSQRSYAPTASSALVDVATQTGSAGSWVLAADNVSSTTGIGEVWLLRTTEHAVWNCAADPGCAAFEACKDGDTCTRDDCQASGCLFPPASGADAWCLDPEGCAGESYCLADGSCSVPQALVCDDGDACTLDGCSPGGGCSHTLQPGSSCDDGIACTANDVCQDAGGCHGDPLRWAVSGASGSTGRAIVAADSQVYILSDHSSGAGAVQLRSLSGSDGSEQWSKALAQLAGSSGQALTSDGSYVFASWLAGPSASATPQLGVWADDGTPGPVVALTSGVVARGLALGSAGLWVVGSAPKAASTKAHIERRHESTLASQLQVGGLGVFLTEQLHAAVVTPSGMLLAVGEVQKTAADTTDGWLVRVQPTGNLIGTTSLQHTEGHDGLYAIAPMPLSGGQPGFVAVGSRTNPGGVSPWIVRLTATGDILWDRTIDYLPQAGRPGVARGVVPLEGAIGLFGQYNDAAGGQLALLTDALGTHIAARELGPGSLSGAASWGGDRWLAVAGSATDSSGKWQVHSGDQWLQTDCSAGCLGKSPAECDDGEPCTTNFCANDVCQNVQSPFGFPCGDGDACSTQPLCGSSTCGTAGTKTCSDGNDCTSDGCDPTSGCGFAALGDGTPCAIGTCSGGVCVDPCAGKSCDDGDPCTDDSCSGGSCEHKPSGNGLSCSSAGACTLPLDSDAALIGHWTFDACDGNDSSGKANHGTLWGTLQCSAGPMGQALVLDGSSWVAVADNPSLDATTNELSFGAWVQLDNTPDYTVLVSKEQTFTTSFVAGGFQSAIQIDEQNAWKYLGLTPVSQSDWQHIAVVYDSQVVRHYLNGKLVSSYALTGSVLASSCGVGIGARSIGCGSPSQIMKGKVDDVFLFSRALDPAEVLALASKTWAGGCTPALPACTDVADCDDLNPCTTDVCNAGGCEHESAPDGVSCEDGFDCTSVSTCEGGVCKKGTDDKTCPDDGNPCTAAYCTKNLAECGQWPVEDGTACAGGTCQSGTCTP